MSYVRRFPPEARGLMRRAEGGHLTRAQLYRLHAIITRQATLERHRDPEYQRRLALGRAAVALSLDVVAAPKGRYSCALDDDAGTE